MRIVRSKKKTTLVPVIPSLKEQGNGEANSLFLNNRPTTGIQRKERGAKIKNSRIQMTTRPFEPSSGHHTYPAIQRKVGFEIELFRDKIGVDEGKPRQLKKGEVLHQGEDWKLTPDGKDEHDEWTPEYVTTAIDETTNAERIPEVMADVANHAKGDLSSPEKWTNGKDLIFLSRFKPQFRTGIFHVTGGLRLNRLSRLIKLLYSGMDDEKVALKAEKQHKLRPKYNSVVAIISLQIASLVNAKETAEDDESAKLGVDILSRTDLGIALSKVKLFISKERFIKDVVAASGARRKTKLFQHKLPGTEVTGRSIDDQQSLTVEQWLNKLWTGSDYTWSNTNDDSGGNFPMEDVGPKGRLFGRAKGVILELRGIKESSRFPEVEDWVDVGRKYSIIFKMLNEKKKNKDILKELEEQNLIFD